MAELICSLVIWSLNKRLEDSNLRFWYFESRTFINNKENGKITVINLNNSNYDTEIRLYHSDLNTENLTEEFLFKSAMEEIQLFVEELMEIKRICRSERNTY